MQLVAEYSCRDTVCKKGLCEQNERNINIFFGVALKVACFLCNRYHVDNCLCNYHLK